MEFPLLKTQPRPAPLSTGALQSLLRAEKLTVRYRTRTAVQEVSLPFYQHLITAIIGPSGCGKSSLLRALNRMNETFVGTVTEGSVFFDGQDIYSPSTDLMSLRRRIGMVFQTPNPFPKSIWDNVAFGLRINNMVKSRTDLREGVERALRGSALWDDVKDRLHRSALELSGGEQQRLCIARALAVQPDVLLLDEPASALDPVSTARIEELLFQLKKNYTIVIVTHNMQQAARVSDYSAFMLTGQLVEFEPTPHLFTNPKDPRTEAYITGRFG